MQYIYKLNSSLGETSLTQSPFFQAIGVLQTHGRMLLALVFLGKRDPGVTTQGIIIFWPIIFLSLLCLESCPLVAVDL
jgi:hypothetical protein